MKYILLAMLLLATVFAQSPELIKCIAERCPDQYAKCKATNKCEDTLNKCANQCGEKVNQTCWTFCLKLPGPAANVAVCAVNQGCIANVAKTDVIGLNLMGAISTYLEQ
jgi:hypothetical protein